MKFNIYLVHHSHTDIGYTHRPKVTINKQVSYIYDVLDYLDEIECNPQHPNNGFKWNCETFIIVD